MGGGRKKRKRGNIFQQAVDANVDIATARFVPTSKNIKRAGKSSFSTIGNATNEATGKNDDLRASEAAAEKAARAQEKFNEETLRFQKDRAKKFDAQKQKEEADANEGIAQLGRDEKRRSARNRQKLKAKGAGGRRSTILTGNRSLGASTSARKTLLGQ